MPIPQTGKNSDAKLIPQILTDDEGKEMLFALTNRQRQILLTLSQYLGWIKRYPMLPDDITNQDDLDRFTDDTQNRLMEEYQICAKIIECIGNDEDVKDVLRDFLQNDTDLKNQLVNALRQELLSGEAGSGPLSPEQLNAKLTVAGCDENTMWGNALYIVQTLNRNSLDLFETMEAVTNNQEFLSTIIGAIPGIGILPFDELVAFAEKIQAVISDSYLAGYDLDYEVQLACAIFCLMKEKPDCQLTLQELTDMFKARLEGIATFQDVFDTVQTLVAAWLNFDEWLGQIVVDIVFASQLGFLSLLNSAFAMPFKVLRLHMGNGIPDDDHLYLCDDCSPYDWRITRDFTGASLGGWIAGDNYFVVGGGGLDVAQGEHVIGQGIVSKQGDPAENENQTENAYVVTPSFASNYTGVVEYELTYSMSANPSNINTGFIGGTGNGIAHSTSGAQGTHKTIKVAARLFTNCERFFINLNMQPFGGYGHGKIEKIDILGTGPRPSWVGIDD